MLFCGACAPLPLLAQEADGAAPEVVLISGAHAVSQAPNSASGLRPALILNTEKLPPAATGTDAALVADGYAAWDANASLGLATGLSLRGFTLLNQGVSTLQGGRNFLNGHPDLMWRFSRDPATVASTQLVAGADATLLGAASPAGALLYQGKTPVGAPSAKVGLAWGSNQMLRSTGDAEWRWGPFQSRAAWAVQRGGKTVEGVKDWRNVALLSTRLPWQGGSVRLDLEYDHYRLPFPFGTMYAGGRFWFDQPYVDARSHADRRYARGALYLDQQLADSVRLSAHWQQARSTRGELLLGSWAPQKSTQATGYYRTIDETVRQRDAAVRLDGALRTGPVQHQWAAQAQRLRLQRDFDGPQNIAGFILDLANPVFPENLSALRLTPRYAFENYAETGYALADTLSSTALPGWEVYSAVRRTRYAVDYAAQPGQPLKPVAQGRATSTSFGAGKRFGDEQRQRVYVARSTAFLPNRGQFANGDFLPASHSRMWELGWALQAPIHAAQGWQGNIALFDLRQSNLAAQDPKVPDASILAGANRSHGVELRLSTRLAGLRWQANATLMRARIAEPASPGQGPYLAGTADAYGSIKVSGPWQPAPAWPLTWWLQWQGAASRPGDSQASFRAPGYGLVHLGLQTRGSRSTQWGMRIDNLLDRRYVRALSSASNVWQGPRRTLSAWVEHAFD